MAMVANEPYQRVATDNGVFDGALIGMAIGAGGAGAGVFGTRMSYNGIDKRIAREQKGLENKLEHQKRQAHSAEKKFNNSVEKQGPRFYEKKGYNRGNEAESDIVNRGNNREGRINNRRQADLNSLDATARQSIERGAEQDAHEMTKRRRGYGYPNPKVSSEEGLNLDRATDSRSASGEYRNEINSRYDGQIDATRQSTMNNLNNNSDVQYRNTVDDRIKGRVDKKYNKYTKVMGDATDTARQLNTVSAEGYGDTVRSKHAYSKMGGWKNAAIIGASAVIGGGLGMMADGLNN